MGMDEILNRQPANKFTCKITTKLAFENFFHVHTNNTPVEEILVSSVVLLHSEFDSEPFVENFFQGLVLRVHIAQEEVLKSQLSHYFTY